MTDFLRGYLRSLLAPALLKIGTWAVRQGRGPRRGDAEMAQHASLMALGVNAAASAFANAATPAISKAASEISTAAGQKEVQKLAAVLGIPSTSQAVLGLTLEAVDAHPTLNFSDKAALKLFLASRILPGG